MTANADDLKKTVRTFPMTDYFDAGQAIMSLGTGEALVTVLSPRGVPTSLAPTRLVPPDSLMAAIPPDEMERRISAGSLYSTYAAPFDRESAHEILSARLAAAKAAMVGATGAPGTPGMTPAQERRAIEARARELERVRRDAERQAKAADRERDRQEAADRREAERAAKQQADMIEEIGGGLIRGVFGTLFGRPARRRR